MSFNSLAAESRDNSCCPLLTPCRNNLRTHDCKVMCAFFFAILWLNNKVDKSDDNNFLYPRQQKGLMTDLKIRHIGKCKMLWFSVCEVKAIILHCKSYRFTVQ